MRGGEGEANGRAKRKTGARVPARPATKSEQPSAKKKEQIKIQFKIEKRMRTAPQIMIVTNAVERRSGRHGRAGVG